MPERTVKVVQSIKYVDNPDLPDGRYDAIWSGYVVRFPLGDTGETVEFATSIGVRGIVKMIVVITDGEVSMERKPKESEPM